MTTLWIPFDSIGRTNLSNKMDNIIKRIQENSENIKTYFPVNESFEKEEEFLKKHMGLKATVISIPKNNERFG